MKTTGDKFEFYESYVKVWRALLKVLLGWSDSRISAWIKDLQKAHQEGMECGLFYHETPVYWVVDLLMPQDLKEEVLQAGEYVDLEGEMHEAIMGESPGECEFDPGFDWHAGKERLDKLIAKWRKKYGIEPKP